ncbi:zinc-binding dehydrogenase [Tsukamurella soli]|uniref:Zinc-binding dehydrogenase n=1 Tax=Tsukamurella soli TaxID=644556 RepID=A0ABP8KEP1_9ACTN
MRAVIVTGGEFTVEDVPAPDPGTGQLVLNVSRTGICGSDLHARYHADQVSDLMATAGQDGFMRSDERIVMGHEFVGTVASYGPGCRKRWPVGTRVVAMPILKTDAGAQLTGFSTQAPGGYAEQVVVQEAVTMPVPDSLSDEQAALTEPMAVAWHAVRRAAVGRRTAIVIGCGPIGLAVITMLRASGVKRIVASDLSPRRRELARECGAHAVVDPRVDSPWDAYSAKNEIRGYSELVALGISTMEKLRIVDRLPWPRVFRLAERIGATPSGPVVFECVGVPGMIDSVIAAAPLMSRVAVVGVCMETDHFTPAVAIGKEIDLRFMFGYDPGEFHDTLHMIASGRVDVRPLITGTVGLGGVDAAFAALGDPEKHAKILIAPSSTATAP